MKKNIIILFLLLLQCACRLNCAVFENSVIKFTYPSEYCEVKPQNAPHMILKLESEKSVLTISRWEYDIDESIDAWNDDVYNRYRDGLPGTNCVLSEKVILQTEYENLKAIKIYLNLEDKVNKIGSIVYVLVKNGDLFIISYNESGVLTRESSSKQTERFLYSLLIKDTKKSEAQELAMNIEKWENYVINRLKKVNQSLPMKVDEVTTLFGVMNVGKTLIFKYRVDSGFVDYMDNEWATNYKEKTLLNMMYSVPNSKEYALLMSHSSINMTYLFYDEKDNLIRTLYITPKDFE